MTGRVEGGEHTTLRGLLTHRCGPSCGAPYFRPPTGHRWLDRVARWRRFAEEWSRLGYRPSHLRTTALVTAAVGAPVGAVVYPALDLADPLSGALGGAVVGFLLVPVFSLGVMVPAWFVLSAAEYLLRWRYRRRAGVSRG